MNRQVAARYKGLTRDANTGYLVYPDTVFTLARRLFQTCLRIQDFCQRFRCHVVRASIVLMQALAQRLAQVPQEDRVLCVDDYTAKFLDFAG
jgi:hypothetical protein